MSELEQNNHKDIWDDESFDDLVGESDEVVDEVDTDLPPSPVSENEPEYFEYEEEALAAARATHSPQENSIVLSTDAYNELVEIKKMMTEFMEGIGDISRLANEVSRLKSTLDHTLTELQRSENEVSNMKAAMKNLIEAQDAFKEGVNEAIKEAVA